MASLADFRYNAMGQKKLCSLLEECGRDTTRFTIAEKIDRK